jgi:hypothetical protein
MKCFKPLCKGKIYKTFPPNELCIYEQHFCYSHYQTLIKCTKLEIQEYYKNCAMVDNTKSSNIEDVK